MLPLVADDKRTWKPGWCTYPDGFETNPDIEVFCGGVNVKMAEAAACWRQGNLLHFGFEQSPADMNEAGQRLLLNAIAYISRFTEDRPIAVTPSVFSGPVPLPRAYLDRRLRDKGDASDIKGIAGASVVEILQRIGPDAIRSWYAEHRGYLHPGTDRKLTIDQEARALGVPFDRVEFFDKAIAALKTGGEAAVRASALLARYSPVDVAVTTADAWEAWLKENRPYLFFSDAGDYRWYVDPLAKKRRVPTGKFRGPARATSSEDVPAALSQPLAGVGPK